MARKNMLNMFAPAKIPKRTQTARAGEVGFDNMRENIDPHIKTKSLTTKEAYIDFHKYTVSPLVPDPVENTEGVVHWNDADHTLEIHTGLGNTIQVAQEQFGIGVNKTGGVADGKVVYLSGVIGNRPTFNFADAREGGKVSLVGVCTTANGDNQEEAITTFGLVRDINTSVWGAGTKLFIAADATGVLTASVPSNPNFRIWVATVVNSHITQGSIFISPRIDFADGNTFESLDVNTDLTVGGGDGGTIELLDTVFDDQQINLGVVRLGASAPTWTAYKGSEVLAFNKAQDNKIVFSAQLSHKYKVGSTIEFHLHDVAPDDTAGTVRWILTYSWADISSDFPAESTLTSEQTIIINSADKHIYFDLEGLTGSSSGVSSVLLCSLTREGTHINDDYDNDIYLVAADFHIEMDTIGSRTELTK